MASERERERTAEERREDIAEELDEKLNSGTSILLAL